MVDLHARSSLDFPNVLKYLGSNIIELLLCVLILVCPHRKVYLLVETVTMVVLIMLRNGVFDLDTQSHTGLVSPAPRNVLDRVSASSHHDGGKSVAKHMFEALSVPLDAEVEMSELVVG